jgi:cytochrome c oxidase assembly factor CtaG
MHILTPYGWRRAPGFIVNPTPLSCSAVPHHMEPVPLLTSFFADDVPRALGVHTLSSTQFDVLPILLIAGAGLLYAIGVVRANRLVPRHRWPVWRTVAFFGGLAVTAVAIMSFIGVYDDVLFWDHMVQHLLLVMVAGVLYATGSPIALALRASAGSSRTLLKKALRSWPARIAGHPITAFALYAVVIPVTHLTSFYNLTLQHEAIHNFEHLVFVFVGYLFWRQVFGIDPNAHRLYPGAKLLYLAFAVPVDTFVGLSLASASHELFPAYDTLHRQWGPSLLKDLHMGGVIMWVGGDTLMLLAMIPVTLEWVRYEERKAIRIDAALDAMRPDPEPTPSNVAQ